MSVTVSAIGAENVPESWLDSVNARLNDLHHADQCGCDGWPEVCENYKQGDWDASPTALLVAAVVLEPLIRERVVAEAMADDRGYYEWGTRMLYPTGDLEICPAFHDGDRTGETLARARMTLAHFPNHRALIRRPVVRGEWETVEEKADDE